MARGWCKPHQNKDGTTTYYIGYRTPSGRSIKRAIGPRKKEADAVLDEVMRAIRMGTYQEIVPITFGELCDKFLEAKKHEIRPKAHRSYTAGVRRLQSYPVKVDRNGKALLLLGDMMVQQINTEICNRVRTYILSFSLSAATINRDLTLLCAMLDMAEEHGYIGKNPAKRIKKPSPTPAEMRYYTASELSSIVDNAPEKHRALVVTAAMTGLRLSELLGLTWDDIDFENCRLFVRRVVQDGAFFAPKTEKSRRTVDFPAPLVEVLAYHRELQGKSRAKNQQGLLFPGRGGRPRDESATTRRILKPAIIAAKLPVHSRPFHALRHSYVTALVNQGEDIKFISAQVGHSSAKVTWDVYAHLYPETKRAAMERLAKNFATMTLLSHKKEECSSSEHPS